MVVRWESKQLVQFEVSVQFHWTRCQGQCLYDVASINVSVKSVSAFQKYNSEAARDVNCIAKYLYNQWIQKYHLSSMFNHRNLVEMVGSRSFDERDKNMTVWIELCVKETLNRINNVSPSQKNAPSIKKGFSHKIYQ